MKYHLFSPLQKSVGKKFTDKCPICGTKPFFTLKSKVYIDNLTISQRKVATEYFKLHNEPSPEEVISFCSNCRAVYRANFFDAYEIGKIYNNIYKSLEEKISGDPGFVYNNERYLKGCSEKMLGLVKDFEKKYGIKVSECFDIGGRDGFRLRDLANNGYNCKVFDPISCEVCDAKISKEHIWSYEIKEDEKADFIFLCSVLEHSIDPCKMIKDCYAHLREGGFLYIVLPSDIETVFDWILFNRWRKRNLAIDNTHYIFFSKRSIIYLLESIGFDFVSCDFSILPDIQVNSLEIVCQKRKMEKSKLSKWLSFDFDLFSSGYLVRLIPRLIKKIIRIRSKYKR